MRITSLIAVVLAGGCAAAVLSAQTAPAPASASAPASRPSPRYDVTGPQQQGGFEMYVVTSDYQDKPVNLYVLLPDSFDKAKRYKVLYVLPAWERSRDGLNEVKKLGLANKYDVICVGPDFSIMPWYADNPDRPKMFYDSYIPEVVVPFIDKTYPTIAKPEGRLLVGFSKSGVGAVTLLLRHPDVFGRCGAWDVPLTQDHTRPEFYGPQDYFLKNYFIPDLLKRQAETLARPPARIAIMGYGFGGIPPTHKLMTDLKIPHFCDDSIRPNHDWRSGWLAPLVEVLMAEDMATAKPIYTPATKPTTRPG